MRQYARRCEVYFSWTELQSLFFFSTHTWSHKSYWPTNLSSICLHAGKQSIWRANGMDTWTKMISESIGYHLTTIYAVICLKRWVVSQVLLHFCFFQTMISAAKRKSWLPLVTLEAPKHLPLPPVTESLLDGSWGVPRLKQISYSINITAYVEGMVRNNNWLHFYHTEQRTGCLLWGRSLRWAHAWCSCSCLDIRRQEEKQEALFAA